MEFEVVGEVPDKAPPPQANQEEVNSITNGNKDSVQPSSSSKGQQEEKTFSFFSLQLFQSLIILIQTHLSISYISYLIKLITISCLRVCAVNSIVNKLSASLSSVITASSSRR